MWLQTLKSKYYAFEVPTRKYSGLVGRISMFAWKNENNTVWNQSFVVQDDMGAYRLDFDVGDVIASTNCQENIIRGKRYRSGVTAIESKQLQFGQMVLMDYHDRMLPTCTAQDWQGHSYSTKLMLVRSHEQRTSAGSIIMQQKDGWKLEVIYPWQLLLHPNRLQTWHISCLFACFAVVQFTIGILQKSIALLEGVPASKSYNPVQKFPITNDASIASWQLCLSNHAPVRSLRGYFSHLKGGEDMPYVGEGCFQEAWHDAEHYLNEAIDSNCQGAYFSYNCTIPSQDRQDSALGRWNRNNTGRLTRQLWPVNY